MVSTLFLLEVERLVRHFSYGVVCSSSRRICMVEQLVKSTTKRFSLENALSNFNEIKSLEASCRFTDATARIANEIFELPDGPSAWQFLGRYIVMLKIDSMASQRKNSSRTLRKKVVEEMLRKFYPVTDITKERKQDQGLLFISKFLTGDRAKNIFLMMMPVFRNNNVVILNIFKGITAQICDEMKGIRDEPLS